MSVLRAGIALLSALGVVLLTLAPGAGAAGSPWVFAPQPISAAVPGGRVFEAAAGATDGRSGVFYGGQQPGNGNSFADTWVNSSAGWVPKCGTTIVGATLPCGPGLRSGHGMATVANGVLLFGGFAAGLGGSAPLGDTWRWNGSTWRLVCAVLNCGPSARGAPAMAGNGVEAVLFGGLGQSGSLDDTWVYNGTAWTQTCGAPLPTACGPGRLAAASMAWDGTHFVLFGGSDITANAPPAGDTWTFDGTRWTKVCGSAPARPCGPPPRVFGAFAYAHDKPAGISGAVLAEGGDLFGATTTTLYRDAWLWHAGAWTELSAPWTGAPIRFPGGNGNPPPGPDPLIGALAAEPGTCGLVYLGTRVTGTRAATTYATVTFTAGRDRTGRGIPNGCTAPRTTSRRPHVVNPTLAATGPGPTRTLTILSIALIAAGTSLTAVARKPRTASPRHRSGEINRPRTRS